MTVTDLLQVVPTTCYRPAIQQFVTKLRVTTLQQLDKMTALLQLVDKLATSLLQIHLVDKLRDLYACTRAKISHLVTSLSTSRQQVVFALLVPSCQQVWKKLLTTCSNLVDTIRLVTRLFQQVRYSHDITILLQPCVVDLVTFLLCHDCIRLVRTTLQQI
jgi:hypothetical protein